MSESGVIGGAGFLRVGRLRIALPDAPRARYDERLRDRDQGILEFLTRRAIITSYPAEAERRGRLGDFYYRPPGGESWADVALRLWTPQGATVKFVKQVEPTLLDLTARRTESGPRSGENHAAHREPPARA